MRFQSLQLLTVEVIVFVFFGGLLSTSEGFVIPSTTLPNFRIGRSNNQKLIPSSSTTIFFSPSTKKSTPTTRQTPQQQQRFINNNNNDGFSSSTTTTTTTTTALFATTSTAAAALKYLHSDTKYVLMAILWLSSFGITLERRTILGKALSAPLATMALALIVANIGLLPFQSPVYGIVNRYFVPMAVPLLLFDSDLRRVINDTGTMLAAFGVGAVATVVGTLLAFPIIPLKSLGKDVGWRIACALAARHIGGAINFVAVAETLQISGNAISAAIAADNVVVAIYFAFLFSISAAGEGGGSSSSSTGQDDTTTTNNDTEMRNIQITPSIDDDEVAAASIGELKIEQSSSSSNQNSSSLSSSSSITLPSLAISISVASTLVTIGSYMTKFLLPAGTSSLPMISILTVFAATIFPKFFSSISETGTALGVAFIQMFFAASGAAGSILIVLQQAPSLFAFSALQIAIHFGTLMAIGKGVFGLPNRELYLSSNANVGGPTTAAAMAQAKEWKRLVLPALLVGILGYATATAIALGLGPILLRLYPSLT